MTGSEGAPREAYAFFVIERVNYDVVTYPDGGEAVLPLGKGQGAILRYANDQLDWHAPIPSADASEVGVERAEAKPALPELKTRRTWSAELFLPEGRERLSIEPRAWPYGLPIDEVTETLNRLAGEGWRVLHVSEDRGLYTGPDTESDSYVTRARYLLARD